MIALLTGKLAMKAPDHLIIDVRGVGYRVQVPFSTYFDLPAEGADVTLHIHTHVKEDAIHLYGFRTPLEKQFFQLLLTVSGIGPKLARDILSNVQAEELAGALMNGDQTRLSAIPGIGRKSAERLILELREKVRKLGLEPAQVQTAPSAPATAGILDDVTSALVNLGYKEAVVVKAIAELDAPADAPMEAVLKLALKRLMR
ncbi:Holliday junction branch migration protein RuvA [Geobacter sp.]|uniref:Holliday junction branch migration protein RuvA n=1 Tax=Geobacter sp. TaxID=46610 RepID=UPI00260B7AD0|nr:Holliday junction branch migration protein RuvA [Geobacter sp.]